MPVVSRNRSAPTSRIATRPGREVEVPAVGTLGGELGEKRLKIRPLETLPVERERGALTIGPSYRAPFCEFV